MTPAIRPFDFARDTFAYRNELYWHYHRDPATGKTITHPVQPPPQYAHYCFVVVRTARQFLYHARFDATQPAVDAAGYRQLIRQVVRRNPRQPGDPGQAVVIPGFDCLRPFSEAHERELKAECGGPWVSYFLRSHWRMVFPFSRGHQEKMARQLVARVRANRVPIIHLARFPQLTINHGIALFAAAETAEGVCFTAYDPNIPENPVQINYRTDDRTFDFPPSIYWGGGRVDVFEIYLGGLY